MSDVQRFRADIQGLRALAIVPVVLYHAHEQWVPGGYVGVDIFFVISGYLITGIILKEIAGGGYSIADFYERRAKRLFPALFVMLTAVVLAGMIILPPPQLASLGEATVATILFLANLFYFQTSDYFSPAAEYLPLVHTWSLAVEEQFYIAFPLVIYALRRNRKLLFGVTLAGALMSLAMCVWLLGRSPSAAFYLPFARAYELLIGAALAMGFVTAAPSQFVRNALSFVGLAMLLYCFAVFDDLTRFPGFAALLPCVGTALVIYAGQGGSSQGGRLISGSFFQFFGNISYSLYLWHWPVLVLARYVNLGPLSIGQAGVLAAVSTTLAWASYRYVEKPIIMSRGNQRTVFAASAAGLMAIGASSMTLFHLNGLEGRFSDRALAAMKQARQDFSPRRGDCHFQHVGQFRYADGCVLGGVGVPASVAIWADSFGAEMAYVIGKQMEASDGAVRQFTASACSPGLDEKSTYEERCTAFNREVLAGLERDREIKAVVVAAHYLTYQVDYAEHARKLEFAVRRLQTSGKKVVLIYPVPGPSMDVPSGLAILTDRNESDRGLAASALAFHRAAAEISRHLDGVVARTGAVAIRPSDHLCGRDICPAIDPLGHALYFDDRHLSLHGVGVLLQKSDLFRVLSDTVAKPKEEGTPSSVGIR